MAEGSLKEEVGAMIKKICAVGWLAAICLGSTLAHASEDVIRLVSVPANANGGFGLGNVGPNVPLVKAITTSSSSIITIRYFSGTLCIDFGVCGIGPNGIQFPLGSRFGTPLQEVLGLAFGTVTNVGALIGAFVPEPLVNTSGFEAVDGTKLASGLGIMPNRLFFLGTYNVLSESPGTLYLGINSPNGGGQHSGSITVTVQTTPSP
jgi:hypothetical protein